ncbi:MAG: hypothetical protein ABIV43_03990 [Candidatus Saccharimonadales bacterium]
MYPPDTDQTASTHNPLAAMRKDEVVIFKVRRHPIGLVGIQITAGLILLGIAAIIFGVLPSVLTDVSRTSVIGIGTIAFLVSALVVAGFLLIVSKVYWGNSWILTSDSLTQVVQTSLFSKQSSQLSLANLEDVTAQQNGILPHMFNYGMVKAETAGEHSKFVFLYCPNPNRCAQLILQAREDFEQGKRDGYGQTQPEAEPQATISTA